MVEDDNMSGTSSVPHDDTPVSAHDNTTVPTTGVATLLALATSEAEDKVEAPNTTEAADKVDVKVSGSASAPRKEASESANDNVPVSAHADVTLQASSASDAEVKAASDAEIKAERSAPAKSVKETPPVKEMIGTASPPNAQGADISSSYAAIWQGM